MRWEYKTVNVEMPFKGLFANFKKVDESDLDKWFNDLGRDGWELVSAFQPSPSTNTTYMLFFFKRPVAGECA